MSLGILSSRPVPRRLNVTAWYDATDPLGTGSAPAASTLISSWADISGNGHDAVQATGANQPSYAIDSGTPSISCNGLDEYLVAPYDTALNASSMSIYIVCKVISLPATYGEVISSVDFGGIMRGYTPLVDPTGEWAWYVGNDTGAWNVIQGDTVTLDQRVLLRCFLNKPSNPFAINNTNYSGDSTDYVPANTSNFYIGCASGVNLFLETKINEIQIYNTLHSTDEIAQVVNYLTAKWSGIS